MQCVSNCFVVMFIGPEAVAALVHMEPHAQQGSPPAGQNTGLMVCSSGRRVGMLNLAV